MEIPHFIRNDDSRLFSQASWRGACGELPEERFQPKNSRNGCLLYQFIGVTNRDRQVRSAKIIQTGEIHTDNFAVAIEKRSAGTAGGGCCIVNNLILQYISDVSLSRRGANEVLL